MQKRTWVVIAVVIAVFFFVVFALISAVCVSVASIAEEGYEKGNIALIDVKGTIISSEQVVEEIRDALENKELKAAILRVESPGGSVAASQEIFEAVQKFKEKKPIVASLGNVAASGGYYVALPVTKIFANPSTITGSIGVRLEHLQLSELLSFAKVKYETLKSGKFKDIASPFREMTQEERELLQSVLDGIHAEFKERVAASRNLKIEDVDKFADGRFFTGSEAKNLGLVDEIGGFSMAIDSVAKLAGIEKPELAKRRKTTKFSEIFDLIGEMKGILIGSQVLVPK